VYDKGCVTVCIGISPSVPLFRKCQVVYLVWPKYPNALLYHRLPTRHESRRLLISSHDDHTAYQCRTRGRDKTRHGLEKSHSIAFSGGAPTPFVIPCNVQSYPHFGHHLQRPSDQRVTHAQHRSPDPRKPDSHHRFPDEATYLQLLGDGKAFLECVLAFVLSLACSSSTRRPVAAGDA